MQAWSDFVKSQEVKLGADIAQKWLRPLKVLRFDSANLYLEAQDPFQVQWFEEHMRPLLKSQLLNNNFRQIKVHLTLKATAVEQKKYPSIQSTPLTFTTDTLDANMTFQDFVSGEANAMIYQLFKELVEGKQPLSNFNPLYLWGETGSGKTHLLMGLTLAFQKLGFKALYVRAETFTEHVVAAIRSSQMQPFRKIYRNVDLLLVDDVHYLAGKAATQEEFFHTFNALHSLNRQIILSSNLAAAALEEIEPRLSSRFEWGVTLHLKSLSQKEKLQILLKRTEALQFPLLEEIIEFLVQTFSSNKALFTALEALVLRCHLQKKESLSLTTEAAEKLLMDLIRKEEEQKLTPEKIVKIVAAKYGMKDEALLGKSQTQECCFPRQIAMYFCRKELHLPFQTIGKLFKKDHSTVMTSVKMIEKRAEELDRELVASLSELRADFQKYTQINS